MRFIFNVRNESAFPCAWASNAPGIGGVRLGREPLAEIARSYDVHHSTISRLQP